MKYILSIFLLFPILAVGAFNTNQQQVIDSLNIEIEKATNDSLKLSLESIREQTKWNMRIPYWDSLATRARSKGVATIEAEALNNVAYIYQNNGDIEKALDYFDKSLQIKRATNDKRGLALGLNNLGLLWRDQGELDQAIKLFDEALQISQSLNDNEGIASSYNNLGLIYDDKREFESAMSYFYKSLAYARKTTNENHIAIYLNNIGGRLSLTDSITKGIFMLKESSAIFKNIGNQHWLAYNYHLIGMAYHEQNQLDSATRYGNLTLQLAKELDHIKGIARGAKLLSDLAKQKGDYKYSLEMYEYYIELNDSLKNSETQKATIRQQTKYEFEKAQLIKEQETKEAERLAAEATVRRNNLQYSLIFLAILLFFGAVLGLGFVKVSPTIAEGLIFFAFLIFFEFLLVLSDPYIESVTNGEPIYKLLANAVLAGAIFPAHAFFERTLKRRLINKND